MSAVDVTGDSSALQAVSDSHGAITASARRGAPEADPVLWAGLIDQPFEHDLFLSLIHI